MFLQNTLNSGDPKRVLLRDGKTDKSWTAYTTLASSIQASSPVLSSFMKPRVDWEGHKRAGLANAIRVETGGADAKWNKKESIFLLSTVLKDPEENSPAD